MTLLGGVYVLGKPVIGPILFVAGKQPLARDIAEEAGGNLVLLQAFCDARRATGVVIDGVVGAGMIGARAKWYLDHGHPFYGASTEDLLG